MVSTAKQNLCREVRLEFSVETCTTAAPRARDGEDVLNACSLQGPKDADFDYLIQQVMKAERPAAYVFNCQMGRGRTTTGMVIASLIILKKAGALDAILSGSLKQRTIQSPPWFAAGVERSFGSLV
jgi:hypothetical protein